MRWNLFLAKFSVSSFFFSSLKSSRDVNLACLLKTSGEKQTYFAYDLFAIVHMVAADEFLMAHNTEVKIAGFRGRELDLAWEKWEGGASVFHHGSRGITLENKFPFAQEVEW